MGFDLSAIKRRLNLRLVRAYRRGQEARLAVILRAFNLTADAPQDQDNIAELKSGVGKLRESVDIKLHQQVGRALSMWSTVETLLIAVVTLLLRKPKPSHVGIVMYSIVNFSVWLNIIDDLFLAEPRFASVKPKWNKINSSLRRLKKIRDRLAHHTIYPLTDDLILTSSLRPARYDMRAESQKFQPLDIEGIIEFIVTLDQVTDRVMELVDTMTNLYEGDTSQGKSPSPPPDRPQD
jgi:hypothetical protein